MKRVTILIFMSLLMSAAYAGPNQSAADTLFANGDFNGAKALYATGVAQDPKDANAALGLARIALYENRLEEAAKSANNVLALDPANAAAKRMLDTIAQRRAVAASADALNVPQSGIVLPFLESEPLPLIQLTVDGHAANLLLDTGGPDIVLDPQFAKELGLEISGGQSGTFAGGRTMQMQNATLRDVGVGPVTLHDLKALILPSRGMGLFKGHQIDGVVGTVFLSRFLATIDYPHHRLVLRPKSADVPANGNAVEVPMWLVGDHFVFANASVNGLADRLFLIDSGGAGVGISPEQETITAAHIQTFPSDAKQGVGGGGAITTIPVVADQVCLGNACEAQVPGLFTPAGSPLKIFPFKAAGVVSHLFLERYSVTFDFAHMKLVLQKP